jgi:hypothetical protein
MEWRFVYEVARVLSKMREGGEEGYYAKKSWRRTMEGGTSRPSERSLNSSVISDTTSILSGMPWLLPIDVSMRSWPAWAGHQLLVRALRDPSMLGCSLRMRYVCTEVLVPG